jgi:hypothetical protein
MPRPSTASFVKEAATDDLWKIEAVYTGAGTSALVKTLGATGIASIARTGVGLHTVTFTDMARLLGFRGIVHTASAASPMVVKLIPASINYSAKTVQIEIWNMIATPALADAPAASLVDLMFCFADNPLNT